MIHEELGRGGGRGGKNWRKIFTEKEDALGIHVQFSNHRFDILQIVASLEKIKDSSSRAACVHKVCTSKKDLERDFFVPSIGQ